MNILATEYNLRHKAFEIYLAGCNGPHCPGCHNPEAWEFDQGTEFSPQKTSMHTKLVGFRSMIRQVWILGGEPLDQAPGELQDLLWFVDRYTICPIILFTRYTLEQVPGNIKTYCDFIKTGQYYENWVPVECHPHIPGLPGITLASSNQRLEIKGINY